MDYQDWEFFEAEVIGKLYSVDDPGPLHGPVTSFVVKRNELLKLVLETTSARESKGSEAAPIANSVYIAGGQVHCSHRYSDAVVTAQGVSPRGLRSTWSGHEEIGPAFGANVQTSSIESLHWTSGRPREVSYVIDWIENLSTRFIWPDSDEVEETEVRSRSLRSSLGDVVIPSKITNSQFGRSCARLSIGGWDVVVGTSRSKPQHIKNPGFVLYLGSPDEETRSRIRGCLSFCLGDYLVYLGCTTFDSEWKPVSFAAVSANALVQDAYRISGRPPGPLGKKYENEIDPVMFSEMTSRLFEIYEDYALQTVFWNFWHASAAPIHMAAAHFGAAIESLQRAYFKTSGAQTHARIVTDDVTWKALRACLVQCIEGAALSADEKRILTSKAQNMNTAPQAILADRLFGALGLELGTLEKLVWKNRNHAAHGAGVAEEDAIQTIRENKILMMLMTRIVLAVSGSSAQYYDYYTLGRPTRLLSEPVPDDRPLRT